MIYFSGCINSFRHSALGYLLTPDMGNKVPSRCFLAADNACFANPANYSNERYLRFLTDKMPQNRTIFATAPDVLGNHAETVERSRPMLQFIRQTGHKAAFVAQDGWSEETTPWDEFDVLFVGGSTKFKFCGGRTATAVAKQRNKWVHMGRVNSLDRLRAARAIGCDSADGTFLRFGPDTNWPKLQRWLSELAMQPDLALEN